MRTALRFLALVLALNAVRYLVGGPIESVTIAEPMHRVMPEHPDVFNADFGGRDFAVSLLYNFVMWATAVGVFHLMRPALRGSTLVRSMKSFGVMALFFVSVAAVYMNHYEPAVRPFYLWSMVDALILFPIVGAANAYLYPRIMDPRPELQEVREEANPEEAARTEPDLSEANQPEE